ncbi:hypothetical protein QEG73_12610 [Chitinophagaceae bacterium 26-R-25]|nr:hypothetical protein [Chitinophagaceae bacterium 26-R-25]
MNELDKFSEDLSLIRNHIEGDLQDKQKLIERLQEAIESLIEQRKDLQEKMEKQSEELSSAKQLAEAKKQLVDKLIGDITSLKQNIDWYKRTYEQRSFLGTIKEKILKKT